MPCSAHTSHFFYTRSLFILTEQKYAEKRIVTAEIENAVIITKNGEIYHCTGELNSLQTIEKLRGIDEKFVYELNRNPADIDIKDLPIDDVAEMNKLFNKDYHAGILLKALSEGFGYRRWIR